MNLKFNVRGSIIVKKKFPGQAFKPHISTKFTRFFVGGLSIHNLTLIRIMTDYSEVFSIKLIFAIILKLIMHLECIFKDFSTE